MNRRFPLLIAASRLAMLLVAIALIIGGAAMVIVRSSSTRDTELATSAPKRDNATPVPPVKPPQPAPEAKKELVLVPGRRQQPPHPPPLSSAALADDHGGMYQKGLDDRTAWEAWFNSLQGDFKTGAFYWASQRSLPRPGSCQQMNAEFTAGCTAAKAKLAPSDALRKTEPDYKTGWNTWTADAMPPSPQPAPEAKKDDPVLVPERRQQPPQPPPVVQPAPAPGFAGMLDKIAGAEVNDKTAAARRDLFNQRPVDDPLIRDVVRATGAVELETYGKSCASLVFSALQATHTASDLPAASGPVLFIQITACARHAQEECDARRYPAEFCKGLREGF